jgi:hypothetical protein
MTAINLLSSSSSGNVQRPSSVIIDTHWGVKLAQRKKKEREKKTYTLDRT